MSDGIDLGKQYGPLPLGGWVIVIAGGLGIAYYINRSQPSGTSEPLVDPGVGTGLVPAGSAFQPSEGGEEQEEDTNQKWGVRALNYLVGQNHDPATSDNAVRKYLAGEDLSVNENALINLAILALGAPPDPLPPVTVPTPEPEPEGTPNLTMSLPSSASKGRLLTLSGRATLDGKNPGTVQFIRVTTWNTRSRPARQWVVPTLPDGRFSTIVGVGRVAGKRRYRVIWRGEEVNKVVRVG